MENSDAFDKRKEAYLQSKQALFSEYMQKEAQNRELNLFFCLNSSSEGIHSDKSGNETFSISNLKYLLSNPLEAIHNGGYLLRWNKKGIIINPSKGFLQRFCELGHHLWDIDAIIVTSPDKNACYDLELIHSLNRQLNNSLASYEQEPHVIHYLLHPAVHAAFAAKLRPHFREEKGSVVFLETFHDGYAEERYELDPSIKLWYSKRDSALMIRLELYKETDHEDAPSLCFGCLTGASWDDSCRAFFQECALLLLGFGQTSPEDLENLGPQKKSIGYWGIAKAAKELPKLKTLLVSEFCPCQGDIRIEIIKKLKREINEQAPSLWPLEQGFCLNLDSLKVKTGTQKLPPYHFSASDEVRVVQCDEAFGPLLYLSKELVL